MAQYLVEEAVMLRYDFASIKADERARGPQLAKDQATADAIEEARRQLAGHVA